MDSLTLELHNLNHEARPLIELWRSEIELRSYLITWFCPLQHSIQLSKIKANLCSAKCLTTTFHFLPMFSISICLICMKYCQKSICITIPKQTNARHIMGHLSWHNHSEKNLEILTSPCNPGVLAWIWKRWSKYETLIWKGSWALN